MCSCAAAAAAAAVATGDSIASAAIYVSMPKSHGSQLWAQAGVCVLAGTRNAVHTFTAAAKNGDEKITNRKISFAISCMLIWLVSYFIVYFFVSFHVRAAAALLFPRTCSRATRACLLSACKRDDEARKERKQIIIRIVHTKIFRLTYELCHAFVYTCIYLYCLLCPLFGFACM